MLKALVKAVLHGWRVHGHSSRGIFLNLNGDRVLFIDWESGFVQYRGSRDQINMSRVESL